MQKGGPTPTPAGFSEKKDRQNVFAAGFLGNAHPLFRSAKRSLPRKPTSYNAQTGTLFFPYITGGISGTFRLVRKPVERGELCLAPHDVAFPRPT